MNAGGKKAVLWGTAVDNLAWWRMVDPEGNWLEVTRIGHNLGKIHDGETVASFDLQWKDGRQPPDRAPVLRTETPRRSRGSSSAKRALARTSPTNFSAACPGVQKEGCDGIITSARWVLHRMPKHMRTVCLEFFGQARDAIPVHRRDQDHIDGSRSSGVHARGPRAPRRALSAGRRLRDQVASAARCRRWCCSATSSATTTARSPRAASEVVRIANARGGEGFIAVSRGTQAILARPLTHRGDRAPHQRVQDQRRRGDPARPHSATTPTRIERINIEFSLNNKIALLDALERLSCGELPLRAGRRTRTSIDCRHEVVGRPAHAGTAARGRARTLGVAAGESR